MDGWPLLKSSLSLSSEYFLFVVLRLSVPLLFLIGLSFLLLVIFFNYYKTLIVSSMTLALLNVLILVAVLYVTSHYLYNHYCRPKKPLGLLQLAHQSYVRLSKDGLNIILRIIAGLLLFILPAIWFTILYTFVPFIDFFNKDSYSGKFTSTFAQSNKILKHSGHLTKNIRFPLFIIILLWTLIPMVFEFFVLIKLFPEITIGTKLTFSSSDFLLYLSSRFFLGCIEIFLCTFLFFLYEGKDSANMVLDWDDPSLTYSRSR